MRPTIKMKDHLLEKLKKRAAEFGPSVSRLIEEAVRVMLNRPSDTAETTNAFKLVTYGAGGQFSQYKIDETGELIAADDEQRYGEE